MMPVQSAGTQSSTYNFDRFCDYMNQEHQKIPILKNQLMLFPFNLVFDQSKNTSLPISAMAQMWTYIIYCPSLRNCHVARSMMEEHLMDERNISSDTDFFHTRAECLMIIHSPSAIKMEELQGIQDADEMLEKIRYFPVIACVIFAELDTEKSPHCSLAWMYESLSAGYAFCDDVKYFLMQLAFSCILKRISTNEDTQSMKCADLTTRLDGLEGSFQNLNTDSDSIIQLKGDDEITTFTDMVQKLASKNSHETAYCHILSTNIPPYRNSCKELVLKLLERRNGNGKFSASKIYDSSTKLKSNLFQNLTTQAETIFQRSCVFDVTPNDKPESADHCSSLALQRFMNSVIGNFCLNVQSLLELVHTQGTHLPVNQRTFGLDATLASAICIIPSFGFKSINFTLKCKCCGKEFFSDSEDKKFDCIDEAMKSIHRIAVLHRLGGILSVEEMDKYYPGLRTISLNVSVCIPQKTAYNQLKLDNCIGQDQLVLGGITFENNQNGKGAKQVGGSWNDINNAIFHGKDSTILLNTLKKLIYKHVTSINDSRQDETFDITGKWYFDLLYLDDRSINDEPLPSSRTMTLEDKTQRKFIPGQTDNIEPWPDHNKMIYENVHKICMVDFLHESIPRGLIPHDNEKVYSRKDTLLLQELIGETGTFPQSGLLVNYMESNHPNEGELHTLFSSFPIASLPWGFCCSNQCDNIYNAQGRLEKCDRKIFIVEAKIRNEKKKKLVPWLKKQPGYYQTSTSRKHFYVQFAASDDLLETIGSGFLEALEHNAWKDIPNDIIINLKKKSKDSHLESNNVVSIVIISEMPFRAIYNIKNGRKHDLEEDFAGVRSTLNQIFGDTQECYINDQLLSNPCNQFKTDFMEGSSDDDDDDGDDDDCYDNNSESESLECDSISRELVPSTQNEKTIGVSSTKKRMILHPEKSLHQARRKSARIKRKPNTTNIILNKPGKVNASRKDGNRPRHLQVTTCPPDKSTSCLKFPRSVTTEKWNCLCGNTENTLHCLDLQVIFPKLELTKKDSFDDLVQKMRKCGFDIQKKNVPKSFEGLKALVLSKTNSFMLQLKILSSQNTYDLHVVGVIPIKIEEGTINMHIVDGTSTKLCTFLCTKDNISWLCGEHYTISAAFQFSPGKKILKQIGK